MDRDGRVMQGSRYGVRKSVDAPKRRTFAIALDRRDVRCLDELTRIDNESYAMVARRSIRLVWELVQATLRDAELVIREKDGTERCLWTQFQLDGRMMRDDPWED